MATRVQAAAIAIAGAVYELQSATTSSVELVHRVTGEQLQLSYDELARVVDREQAREPRLLDTLPKHVIQAATILEMDIREVLTGVGRGKKRRAEYDLETTTQEVRITRKLKELEGVGRGMARSTFFDKLAKYQRDGVLGLVDGRAIRQFEPLYFVDDRLVPILTRVIAQQKNESTGTVSRIIKLTNEAIESQYPVHRLGPGEPPVRIPGRSAYYNLIKMLGKGKHATGSAKTRRSLGERPDRTFAKHETLLPGSRVEVDTNTMDIHVQKPDGGRTRPYLTVMVDVYSRSIIAYTMRITAAKGVDHAHLIAQAMTPRANRPSRTQWRDFVGSTDRRYKLLAQDVYEAHVAKMPYIFPSSITTDRGRDFTSTPFDVTAAQHGIEVILSAPRTPTGKPHVERQFGTINTLFVQHLKGYVGRSPEHKGKEVPTEKLLTLEMLRELFEDWVVSEWQNRPHTGLRDRLHPARLMTPNEKAAEASLSIAQLRVPLTRDHFISMLETETRTIGDTGVRVGNRYYDSEELHPHRHRKSSNPRANGKWTVKVDPYNPTCVWVERPGGGYIECPERGTQDRMYEPDFTFADDDDYRATTAQLDAELSGTPHVQHDPLPEHTITRAVTPITELTAFDDEL